MTLLITGVWAHLVEFESHDMTRIQTILGFVGLNKNMHFLLV